MTPQRRTASGDRRPPARAALRALVGALVAVLVLSGCGARLVRGEASPKQAPVSDVAPQDLPIVGAADDDVDRIARNALVDLNTYWAHQFPEVYRRQFTPLAGGYFSVDPADLDPAAYPGGEIGCGQEPSAVEDNAFYCSADEGTRNGDAIQYDRSFLRELAGSSGRFVQFIPALVMAHEFGHAVQGRVGYPRPPYSIAIETQADCFAGAWTKWVALGQAQHSSIRPAELDEVLRGYLLLRDPVGTGAGAQEAHGSYFDRVSAFQEGFDDGPTACRDDFGEQRQYTQARFSDQDLLSNGDASYRVTVGTFVPEALPEFWTGAFTALGRGAFQRPDVAPFSRRAPACAADRGEDLVYCEDGDRVGYDETDLVRPLYEDVGDYAVLTAVAVPYALAAREQLGLSTGDRDAVRSAVCLAGAFTQAVLAGRSQVISISPGDVDESVRFLLEYGTQPEVLGDAGLTGFQLVDVFRGGVFEGLPACDVDA
ncbi:neutral zinc metallopeptidase [Modestobacter sp. NPDC049651]|uniref:neutral zinc metallopeptidase n=1 Tax=unclassified Modestobacter TaxID=2643866 RepID=UPI0033FA745C